MNKEHFVNKSNTDIDSKDLWQTPKALFDAIDREFSFDIDVCASSKNVLCANYFSEEHSALEHEWSGRGACFINPPYSQTSVFLERAAQQSQKHGLTVVALVNANTDTQWFAQAAKTANEIRLITGRVGFVKPDGKKANGNTKGQCLIIWRGRSKTPCNITMIDRKELEL